MRSTLKIVSVFLAAVLVTLIGCILILQFTFNIDLLKLSGWHQSEDGSFKYLDAKANPIMGWASIDGSRYYFDPNKDGAMLFGWLSTEQGRYYLDTDGKMHTGWLKTDEILCYFGEDGIQQTGWVDLDGQRFFLLADGAPVSGWVTIDQKLHFFDSQSRLQTGWIEDNAKRYYLDENGQPYHGWLDTEDGRYYLGEDGAAVSGWITLDGVLYYLNEQGKLYSGWLAESDYRFYLNANGTPVTGWAEIDGSRYYFDSTGIMQTGWLQDAGDTYYLRSDGTMAVGEVVIDEISYFFTSQGKHVILVNRWNPVPDDYAPELVSYQGHQIDKRCLEPLKQMLSACKANGLSYSIDSVYRDIALQTSLFQRRYNERLAQGYSEEEAYELVALGTAIPGTSEHHLGLAVDIGIGGSESLHQWLAQHSWEYGFIVRYPNGTTEYTGIKYEPWHFRYVGKELAKELFELNMCMEEYMAMLTDTNP